MVLEKIRENITIILKNEKAGNNSINPPCSADQTSVSIALANYLLEKIDREASKQKRPRSEYIELHFENVFSEQKN